MRYGHQHTWCCGFAPLDIHLNTSTYSVGCLCASCYLSSSSTARASPSVPSVSRFIPLLKKHTETTATYSTRDEECYQHEIRMCIYSSHSLRQSEIIFPYKKENGITWGFEWGGRNEHWWRQRTKNEKDNQLIQSIRTIICNLPVRLIYLMS